MEEQLKVSVPELRQAAQRLRGVAEQFCAAWTSFCTQVSANGDIFGKDDVGGLIGASYQAAHALADDAFISAANALTDFANGLGTMAGSYETTENDNRSDLTALEV